MKIAWVILTWNSEKYIKKCIDSILSLPDIDSQIIITDNGSKDRTVALIKKNYGSRVLLIELPENRGTTAPRNMAIKKADKDADYICLLDSDTEVNGKAVRYLTEVLEKEPNALVAGPKLLSRDGKAQPSARNFPTITSKILKACPLKRVEQAGRKMERCIHSRENAYYKAGVIMSACWMVKPEAFETIGLLDEYYFYSPEDTEYCLRIHINGKDVLYCPEVAIRHEWQRLSKKKIFSRFNTKSLKGHIHMFIQYGYCFSTRKLWRAKAN